MSKLVSDSSTIWNLLNGVLCVYKPFGESVNRVRNSILSKLTSELNELKVREPKTVRTLSEDGNEIVRPSFADHPLVVGPRYQIKDFKCIPVCSLGYNTSGLLVLGLNNGTKMGYNIRQRKPMRTYQIKATLGYETDDLFHTGKIIKKDTFRHVRRGALERLLETIQASHQRLMFELSGVDISSQEAYELASSGLIRPIKSYAPIIYSATCIEYNPPDFAIELRCINEYEAYLLSLIREIGGRLRSAATCTQIRCIQYSNFTLDDALLKKHWTLENVIENLGNSKRRVRSQMINEHKISSVKNGL